MKICFKCKQEKELIEFNKKKENKDGYNGSCKICLKHYFKEHSKLQSSIENKRKYVELNSIKIKKQMSEWRSNNKEHIKEYDKIQNKLYYKKNSEKIKLYTANYAIKNKEKISIYRKKYAIKNKEKRNAYSKEYMRNKMNTDSLFKLKHGIRRLIYMSLKGKGTKKKSKTFNILGCTVSEFKIHLEKQFTKGMTWKNQGKWHLDHIYPVSLAKDEEELIKLNHYTNFQPLWAADNLKKGNKIIEKQLILI